ncbi:MAG: OsmC family protein [Desulfovibrionaceae bacterium]
MPTVTAQYLGNLRVACVHEASGTRIITDAPVDNHGKGEAFSPTDLCATAVATCAMTIIGLYAQNHALNVDGTKIDIAKVMNAHPRRIGEIRITFIMPDNNYSDKDKQSIERAAHTCPVHLSLHPDVVQSFIFQWADQA